MFIRGVECCFKILPIRPSSHFFQIHKTRVDRVDHTVESSAISPRLSEVFDCHIQLRRFAGVKSREPFVFNSSFYEINSWQFAKQICWHRLNSLGGNFHNNRLLTGRLRFAWVVQKFCHSVHLTNAEDTDQEAESYKNEIRAFKLKNATVS